MIDKFGTVEQFFAGYFHQDWDLDGDDDGEVIASFVEGESVAHVQEVVKCLHEKLNTPDFDTKAADIFLQQAGCAYRYQEDGHSSVEWLSRLLGLLRENLSKRT